MEAARREVGENISLAHLLISTCLRSTPISTPALRDEDTLKLPRPYEPANRSFSSRAASHTKSIVDPFSRSRDMQRIGIRDKRLFYRNRITIILDE